MITKSFALICSHNGEKYIKQQIDSIYATNEHFEILIYDFNSQDNTLSVCTELSKQINLTIYSYSFTPGAKVSFLFALNKFKEKYHNLYEDYILFISDQDDIWKKDKFYEISKFHMRIGNSVPQFVHHNVSLIDEYGKNIPRDFYKFPSSIIKTRFSTLYFSVVIGHTISINKQFVELLKTFDGEDIIMHDWWLSIIADLNDCRYFLDYKLGYYRIHTNNVYGLNLSGRNFLKKFQNFLSNCRTITRQRKKILSNINDNHQFREVFIILLKNFRFKLIILLIGQRILTYNE